MWCWIWLSLVVEIICIVEVIWCVFLVDWICCLIVVNEVGIKFYCFFYWLLLVLGYGYILFLVISLKISFEGVEGFVEFVVIRELIVLFDWIVKVLVVGMYEGCKFVFKV